MWCVSEPACTLLVSSCDVYLALPHLVCACACACACPAALQMETNLVVANAKVEALEKNNRALRQQVAAASVRTRSHDASIDVDDLDIDGDGSDADAVDLHGYSGAYSGSNAGPTFASTVSVPVFKPSGATALRPMTLDEALAQRQQVQQQQRGETKPPASVASLDSHTGSTTSSQRQHRVEINFNTFVPSSSMPAWQHDLSASAPARVTDAAPVTAGSPPAIDRVTVHRSAKSVNVAAAASGGLGSDVPSFARVLQRVRDGADLDQPPSTPDDVVHIRQGIASLDADIAALEVWLSRAGDIGGIPSADIDSLIKSTATPT